MNKIDTGFGFSFEVIKRNNNIEIKNELAGTETIFTPRGSVFEL
jgi:hypothetical protein